MITSKIKFAGKDLQA